MFLVVALAAAGCVATDRGAPGRAGPLFTLLPSSQTGVTFTNALPENAARNGFTYQYYYNGGGVAAGDLNGDGLPELYFTANLGPNRLYLNRGGLRFEDVTDRAGVAGLRGGWAAGVTFVDVNADGRLDIYVSQSGPFGDPDLRRNLLYINQGSRDGVPFFVDQAAAHGLDDPAYTTQAAFFDYDGDGDLDVYLLNHGIPAYRSLSQLQAGASPTEVDKLYRNDAGRFVDVSAEAGLIDTNLGFGLGVSAGDLNNDGRSDLYVANDYSGRDYLYLGQPDRRFLEVLEQAMGHIPLASMGSDIADVDGDGWLDVVVLEMAMETHYDRTTAEFGNEADRFAELVREGQHYQYMANGLQWNRGLREGRIPVFSEIAYLTGVARTDWSWAALFADMDNDGRSDLFVSNGMAGGSINPDFDEYMGRRVAEVEAAEGRVTHSLLVELLERLPRRKVPNHVYRNEGDLRFSNQTVEWGLDQPTYSNGAVHADLDRDGDLELVVNNLFGEASIYRNHSRETTGAHFLAVQLRGPPQNTFGVGARVRLKTGGAQQVQELQLTRGYQSSVEPVFHFGLGASTSVDTLEVIWPDGSREVRTGVAADSYLTLDYQDGRPRGRAGAQVARSLPLFVDARSALRPVPRHRATESAAHPVWQPYPTGHDEIALAAGDLDGDGMDDFVFGGSAGEASRIYFQQQDGTFSGATALPQRERTGETVAAAIFDADGDGRNDLWLVTRSRAGSPDEPMYRHDLHLNAGGARFRAAAGAVPQLADAGVVLAPGDYDGDRDMDLFVGTRTVPGSGRAAGSRLLRNDGGVFRDVTTDLAAALAELRTVTDAVWADLDGDAAPDLLIAGEWMPVTVMLNDGSRLRDATEAAGLQGFTGWWQSIAAADFDGDGDIDIVAGNMGLNYPYRPSPDSPFELYVGDFDGDGEDEAVPAYYEAGRLYPWLSRTELAQLVPSLLDRFPTHDAFARATLQEIIGPEQLSAARRFEVRTLETSYFENAGGGRLRSRALPRAAQISPVTAIVPADFDANGVIDLVLAGNLYKLDASVPRQDAGVGLFLSGDGAGGFQGVPPSGSGLWLTGEVRRLVVVRVGRDDVPGLLAAVAGGEALHVRAAKGAR